MVWFVPKGLSFPEGTKEDFMKFKKLLALVLSAVMALSILAGCGKNSNYSDVAVQIFDQLMDGKTEMNFEEDADLLKALQDAISQGNGDLSTIRNLVVQALGVKNVFSFSVSGAGAAKDGQHGIAVCRVTGKTPEEAARNAFAQVKGVLEALLANGTYKTYVSMVKSGSDYYLALDLVVVKAGTVSTGTDEGKDEDTEEPQEPSIDDYGETDKDSRHLVIRGDVQSLDKLADAINKANAQFTTVDTVDFTNYKGQIPANVLAGTGIEEVVVNASSDVATNAFVNIVAEGKPLTITVKGTEKIEKSLLGGAKGVNLVLNDVTNVTDELLFGWTEVKGISLPKVTHIGSMAFAACKNLEKVYIGDLMAASNENNKNIARYAFTGCDSLKVIYYGKKANPDWGDIGWKFNSRNHYTMSYMDWAGGNAESNPPVKKDGCTYIVYYVSNAPIMNDAWPQ